MKKGFIKIFSAVLIVAILCSSLIGCSKDNNEEGNEPVTQSDLMAGIAPQTVAERLPDEKYYDALKRAISAVAVKSLSEKENSAVSPLASLLSMSLSANALSDKAQSELLLALGDFKMTALNEYNATYSHIIKQNAGVSVYSSFRLNADKNFFSPEKSFLQLNADYYGADVYLVDFAASDVNALLSDWVTAKLGVQNLTLNAKCSSVTPALLSDTLAFTDSFEVGFSGKETGIFNSPSGKKTVSYLLSNETLYVEIAKAKGIAKTLENGYTFTALLPQGSSTLEQLIQSLDATTLTSCYGSISENSAVKVKIPELSFNYSVSTVPAFKSLGIKTVFENKNTLNNEKAALTLENVLNITAIRLTENGFSTSAASPTAPETVSGTEDELPVLAFDKPFVFILFDTAGIPLTIGTVVNP